MGHHYVLAEDAETFQVLGGAHSVVAQTRLHVGAAVVEVQCQRDAIVVGQALGLPKQPGRGEVGAEGHGPGPHPPVQRTVVIPDGTLHDGDGLVGVVDWQVDRVGQVGHVGADNDAAAGLLVGTQPGV